jgi:hypothetical protein
VSNSSHLEQAIQKAVRLSSLDPLFRALALSNPTAALAKVHLYPVPAGCPVLFVEEGAEVSEVSPETRVVRLPRPDEGLGDELSDADLDQVAGGSDSSGSGISGGW